jgi:hypothetical protein
MLLSRYRRIGVSESELNSLDGRFALPLLRFEISGIEGPIGFVRSFAPGQKGTEFCESRRDICKRRSPPTGRARSGVPPRASTAKSKIGVRQAKRNAEMVIKNLLQTLGAKSVTLAPT